MRAADLLLRPTLLALAVSCAWPAAAQEVRAGLLSGPAANEPAVAERPSRNASVGEILVAIDRAAFVADGVTRVAVDVELRDLRGAPLQGPALVTIESDARVLLPGAPTDETGPGALDRDRSVPGVQLQVDDGKARFWLLAPATPREVRLRVTAGAASAAGTVSFLPELREMIAVGLVEGVIALRRKGDETIRPVDLADGFEQELRAWSRRFSNDRHSAAVRAALFLKGKIRGDALLTLAYDSDKETHKRLLREVRGDEYYPVYGDASIRSFDAQSASKLYLRIDKDRHYLLYGDFQTSASFAPAIGGGRVAPLRNRDLGQYSRTLTGVRGHAENERGYGNVFASRDTLKQLVEEYAANGTSGPFAVANSSGIAGSEKVEVITRDRNNPALIVAVEPLLRLNDYVFEPFSGRILLNRPIASRDPLGNPVSIRITYEVDQGGDAFWLFGADGQFKLMPNLELGGSLVEDRNPLARYRLGSANISARLGANTRLVAEVARSEGRYNTGTGLNTNVAPGLAGIAGEAGGNAWRFALEHKDAATEVRAYYGRSDAEFDNPAASFAHGRGDGGLRATHKLNDTLTAFGEFVRSEDRVADGTRSGAQVGLAAKLTDRLTVDVAVKRMEEDGKPVAPGTTLPANPSSNVGNANSPLTPSGGFFGTGADALHPSTGTTILSPTAPAPSTGAATPLEATTLQLGAQLRATDSLTLAGEVEHDVTGDDKRRIAVGAGYRIAERSRLYARYETQQGLASIYSLNPADRSTAFIFGADTTYAPGAQVYSEYRLRDALGDAVSTRESQMVNGLRNTWQVGAGVQLTTGAEYLKVLDGGGQQAYALVGGIDYTANPLWKAAARLEWRRLDDDRRTPDDETQDSYLSTITYARKLARDWTLLVRNYALFTDFAAGGDRLQERFQFGFAYRDTDTNRVNALAKYEYKLERDSSGLPSSLVGTSAAPSKRNVHLLSTHADYHPSRPWWLTGRLAAKSVQETFAGAEVPRYTAYLLGGRVVYDVTERWDVGLLGALLYSPQGRARQYAYGLEVGYLVQTNLWLSVGYNINGFSDRDLTGSDYTQRGLFIRLRFKFDENLFKGSEPDVNRALDRPRQ
jgi:hypothetical protein